MAGADIMLISEFISALAQVFVFLLIPLAVYVIGTRKAAGFFDYVGLRRPTRKAMGMGVLIGLVVSPLTIGLMSVAGLRDVLLHPESFTWQLSLLRQESGLFVMMTLAIIGAGIRTALAEEILFRGFVAKRLIAWRGFWAGNVIQAVVFGAVHSLLFVAAGLPMGITGGLAVFGVPTVMALLMGWLNERFGNGSIWPGWSTHAVSNLITFVVVPLMW